jgi:tetratricopeptide (TPR) repeat protein
VFRYLTVSSLLIGAAFAQMNVSGEITGSSADMSNLVVRVEGSSPDDLTVSSSVGYGGQFTLNNIRPGTHLVRVLDAHGNELLTTTVTVSNGNTPLTIDLPGGSAPPNRPTGDTVSVYQLQHRPPTKAVQAAGKAEKFSEQHQYEKAAEELQKAVTIDPGYTIAYNNLGVQWMRLGQNQKAADAFAKAAELDPSNALSQANMAVALARSGDMKSAERWARRAVDAGGNFPLAHYVLGCMLAQAGKYAEAEGQLQQAAGQMPIAEKALAQLERMRGRAKAETATDALKTPEPEKPAVSANGQR